MSSAQNSLSGLEIFKRERVRPDCWIAPAHSFDENTVKLLSELGVTTISDGLSLFPHRDARNKNVVWIPQQLWRFRYVPFGVWTICIHSCDRMYKDPKHFRERIRLFRKSITTLPEIVAAYSDRRESVADELFGELWHHRDSRQRRYFRAPRAKSTKFSVKRIRTPRRAPNASTRHCNSCSPFCSPFSQCLQIKTLRHLALS